MAVTVLSLLQNLKCLIFVVTLRDRYLLIFILQERKLRLGGVLAHSPWLPMSLLVCECRPKAVQNSKSKTLCHLPLNTCESLLNGFINPLSLRSGNQPHVENSISPSSRKMWGQPNQVLAMLLPLRSGGQDWTQVSRNQRLCSQPFETTLPSAFQLGNQTHFFQSALIRVRLAHNDWNQHAKAIAF